LFRTNCAQCHTVSGKGGALTDGMFAPSLKDVDPKHIYEAMLTGPQNMPSFPDSTMPQDTKADIIAYLQEVDSASKQQRGRLHAGQHRAGVRGPVRLGVRLGTMIAIATWVAARTTKAKKS